MGSWDKNSCKSKKKNDNIKEKKKDNHKIESKKHKCSKNIMQ